MSPFAAVLFDLDGTLCTQDQDGEDLYFAAFERAGIESFGRPRDLWRAFEDPPNHDDPTEQLADGFRAVAAQYDRTVDELALAEGFLAVVDYGAVSFRSGAETALQAARAHAPVGLITNGPERRQAVKLDSLGLAHSFDVVVYAGDLPRRKPHRDPFDRAVDALDVDHGASLYVGNSLEYDVAGARNAGLRTAWCPEDHEDRDHDGYDPDFVLDSPADLVGVLDGD